VLLEWSQITKDLVTDLKLFLDHYGAEFQCSQWRPESELGQWWKQLKIDRDWGEEREIGRGENSKMNKKKFKEDMQENHQKVNSFWVAVVLKHFKVNMEKLGSGEIASLTEILADNNGIMKGFLKRR
jgi:hypothetical protein